MPRIFLLLGIGIAAGIAITLQTFLNATLGKRTGYFGSTLVVTLVSIAFVVVLILLFPQEANLSSVPNLKEWYLYLGGILGILIVLAPILLVPRIGATFTLSTLVIGQLVSAFIIDQFGLFGMPRVEISLVRVAGLVLLLAGAYLLRP